MGGNRIIEGLNQGVIDGAIPGANNIKPDCSRPSRRKRGPQKRKLNQDPYGNSADGDADTDGVSNLDEYTAGTLPTDKTSRFALSVVRNHDDVTISFQTIDATGAGYEGLRRYYTLERRPLLNMGDWQEVPGLSRILGATQSVTYTEPVTGAQFFRVRVWLEGP